MLNLVKELGILHLVAVCLLLLLLLHAINAILGSHVIVDEALLRLLQAVLGRSVDVSLLIKLVLLPTVEQLCYIKGTLPCQVVVFPQLFTDVAG